jgi:hypothetical protein
VLDSVADPPEPEAAEIVEISAQEVSKREEVFAVVMVSNGKTKPQSSMLSSSHFVVTHLMVLIFDFCFWFFGGWFCAYPDDFLLFFFY